MKLRKLFAMTMALVLAAAPMSVHAAGELTAPGEAGELTTGAGVNYANTTVYKVTLPTSGALKFALDPQGLSTLDEGTVSANSTGKIVSSTPWTVKNESSVDITVSGNFYVADADDSEELSLLALEDKGAIDNSAKEICMILQEKVTAEDSTVTYTDLGAITSASTSDKTSIAVNMGKAEYQFTGDEATGFTYERVAEDDNFTQKDLVIGGVCAKDYDWSKYVGSGKKTLELHAVFGFEKAATQSGGSGSSTPTDSYVMTKNGDGSVSYTFVNKPTGTMTTIKIDGTEKAAMVTKGNAVYENGVLTIKSNAVASNFATAKTYTIKPTIGGQEYTLTYVVQ